MHTEPVLFVSLCITITYLMLEANGERASLAAKLLTPLKVEQEESGSKKHRAPVGIACRDALTGVLSDEMSGYSGKTPG